MSSSVLIRSRRFTALAMATVAAVLFGTSLAAAAGPPYPEPVNGQRVYDTAVIFNAADVRDAETVIAAIEKRTGVEIVVYTQVKPESDTPELAADDAHALGNQWGVGRKGFDDGLVILFDMDTSRCHGQVQLDAGAGFKAAFLSDSERQAIYENDMLPYLRSCSMGLALSAALQKVDAAATPEHAATLERARQLDAVLGLVIAPLLLVLLVGFAAWHWLRYGRDPVYLDDPSIHMPAPPPDLTPASAALVWDGRSSRHTLTTALIDLASHGVIAFREESEGLLIHHTKVGIESEPTVAETPALGLIRRNPLGPAELQIQNAIGALPGADSDGYIDPEHVPGLASHTDAFDKALEAHVVKQGWFTQAPKQAVSRWLGGGIIEVILGIVATVIAVNLPSQGILLLGLALLIAGIATMVIGYSMPCRTMSGAMIRAMLAAYRRTLSKTMDQARSMQQVVDEAKLPWLQTPDQAFVWGVALGLQSSVQGVLDRSVDDAKQTTSGLGSRAWFPIWYGSSVGGAAGGGNSGGLMSSSPIPNVGAMFAAIGTVGSAPSSSGSGGGGGGSFGGGGGFSGGGAGGGF